MKLMPITKANFDEYYNLLEQDFILEERRTKQDELSALKDERFKPYFIDFKEKKIGYFTCWEFDNFIFGEHFAINKELRNHGYGTMFWKYLFKKIDKPIIFEIEKPVDETTIRRGNFYKKLGIQFNDYEYFQPSYHNGEEKVEMLILSYPNKLKKSEFQKIIKQIYQVVYKKQ